MRGVSPARKLLLKVAAYFEQGHFCQGTYTRYSPDGKLCHCPLSAIDTLGKTLGYPPRDRLEAKMVLANYLVDIEPDYRTNFTNGKIDADETIIAWVDGRKMTRWEAADALRSAASNPLQKSHTPTVIESSKATG